MKIPKLTWVLVCAIFTLFSCDQEDVIASDARPSPLELRCCTDESDLSDNQTFMDLFGNLQVALLEPANDIIAGLDEEYILSLLDDYEECVEHGTDPSTCLEVFDVLLDVKAYVEGLNTFLLDSLRQQYEYLTDREFMQMIGENLFALTNHEEERQLPCFTRYQTAIIGAFIEFAEDLTTNHPSIAAGRLLKNYALAKINYCQCMYNMYGHPC